MFSNFLIYLVHGNQDVRACMMFITMIGMLLLVGLALFNCLKVYGEEQEQEQPTISICQEELNETKCNEIEPVCPETFPGCVGNSSSSSSKP
ncbi:MAG: hypothetical protein M3264_12480 [Thermoproteota archaeon]|nr:hypothetical protein [Thermoproteota archaeon]